MGEYVKYKGREMKIGTCENLYYATYLKYIQALGAGLLEKVEGSLAPSGYARPDSGFRFRFPFPDEDHLSMEKFVRLKEFHRGLPVITETGDQIEITQQKLLHRASDRKLCLVLVTRDPSNGQSYRLEDDDEVRKVLSGLVRHHTVIEDDPEKRNFYRKIGARILKGYKLPVKQIHAIRSKKVPSMRKGRGRSI